MDTKLFLGHSGMIRSQIQNMRGRDQDIIQAILKKIDNMIINKDNKNLAAPERASQHLRKPRVEDRQHRSQQWHQPEESEQPR